MRRRTQAATVDMACLEKDEYHGELDKWQAWVKCGNRPQFYLAWADQLVPTRFPVCHPINSIENLAKRKR